MSTALTVLLAVVLHSRTPITDEFEQRIYLAQICERAIPESLQLIVETAAFEHPDAEETLLQMVTSKFIELEKQECSSI